MYEKVVEAYTRIFKRVGLGEMTYYTVASGGTFSKYSHEFQTLTSAGEDTIHLSEKKKLAVNGEIVDEEKTWFGVPRAKLKEEKAVEVGNIFKLKTKYAKVFGLQWRDKDGTLKDVIMNCYGIGLPRLMGTVVEIFNDENGIIWPDTIAPYQVHLISLSGTEKKTDVIYEKLISEGIEVLYDDRDVSPGEKFADADLIGIPKRLVVSSKTLESNSVEIKLRTGGKEKLVKIKKLYETLKATI